MTYKRRDELVSSLRELADFIEDHGVKLPDLNVYATSYNVTTYEWVDGSYTVNEAKTREKLRRIVKTPGEWRKNHSSGIFEVSRTFGCIKLEFNAVREAVCEKVVVGKKTVPKFRKYGTQEVDDVEWVCGDPLLAGN